ncbi:MAG: hypothetical protein ACRETM_04880, partial [Stenotrophobium sp.]
MTGQEKLGRLWLNSGERYGTALVAVDPVAGIKSMTPEDKTRPAPTARTDEADEDETALFRQA